MVTLDVSEVRQNFSETVSRVRYGAVRVLLERRGQPVAAIIPLEDLARLESTKPPRNDDAA